MCGMEAAEEAKIIAKALEESKAEDVKIYDVRGKSSLTDFFVVGTGSAAPHLKALVANAQQAMREAGVKRNRMAGDPECGWIVADFIDDSAQIGEGFGFLTEEFVHDQVVCFVVDPGCRFGSRLVWRGIFAAPAGERVRRLNAEC